MPKREKFIPKQVYHIYNHGVENQKIFLEDKDYQRFVDNVFEFCGKNSQNIERPRKLFVDIFLANNQSQESLVDILAFCLMPDHFHLLLRPQTDNGITMFMRKLSIGYANYFNPKYKRSGTLFRGRYKSALVNKQDHLNNLSYYLYSHPLDLFAPQWRNGGLKDYKSVMDFLNSYRWSSYNDSYKEKIEVWLKALNPEILRDFMLG